MSSTAVTDLEQFLTYLGKKGLLTPAAAASRRAAVGKIFAVLGEEERGDVFTLDVEGVISRFANLHGKGYTPGSVQAYASRMRASMDDFRRYVDDPVNFKMAGNGSSKLPKTAAKAQPKTRGKSDAPSASHPPAPNAHVSPPAEESVFPIPIRQNLVVKVYGLPFDLSEAEANKIASVIKAMAT
jgi:hypothetical protein